MKQIIKYYSISIVFLFSSVYALIPEVHHLTRILYSLENNIKNQPSESFFSLRWIILPAARMMGPVTTPIITNQPPYVLQSGNEIQQLEVLSQFLTLGAFTKKDYQLASGFMAFLLPSAQQNLKYVISFIQKYIDRLTADSSANKNLQQRLTKLWKGNDSLIGAGGASCGYQAIKNAISILQAVQANKITENLTSTLDINLANQLFGLAEINELILNKNEHGTWRRLIINNFRKKSIIRLHLIQTLKLEQYFIKQDEAPDQDIYTAIKRSIETIYQDILDQFLKNNETTLIINITNEDIVTIIKNQNPNLRQEVIEQYMLPGVNIDIQQQIPINPLFNNKQQDFIQGEWLHEDEIKFILQEEIKKLIIPQFFNFSVFETSIKNLENEKNTIQHTAPEVALTYKVMINERKNMISTTFNKIQQNYIHAFILGGMSQASPQGHWIALVVNIIQGKIQYFILDSSNAPRYQILPTLAYKNPPIYSPKNIMGPTEVIADHIHEIINLIEQARK